MDEPKLVPCPECGDGVALVVEAQDGLVVGWPPNSMVLADRSTSERSGTISLASHDGRLSPGNRNIQTFASNRAR
jgi:hypothetical protein